MITDRTLTLLQSLLQTHSPTKQLELLHNYCLYEADMTQQSHQVETLLLSCKEIIESKHQQGIKAAAQKKVVVKKLVSHSQPKFFPNFNGKGNCSHCRALIDGNQKSVPAFFHRYGKESDKVNLYCPLPSCFPATYKNKMMEDRDYINTMLKGK
jgi:hypothetical protein